MSLLTLSSRRRRILLGALALAAGGYASYRLYHSPAIARKRQRLAQIIRAACSLSDAVTHSAESFSILSYELRSFLLSDSDTVPRSLRQAFKIGQCSEFQETITVLSAALTAGLLRGAKQKQKREGQAGRSLSQDAAQEELEQRGRKMYDALGSAPRVLVRNWTDPTDDLACREIREVCYTAATGNEASCPEPELEAMSRKDTWPGSSDIPEKSFSSGDTVRKRSRKVGILIDRARRGQQKSEDDFMERLLSKMFSEPGVGFASAVAGNLARNCVLAFFDNFRTQNSDSETEITNKERVGGNTKIIDVLCNDKFRELIGDCIQTLVSTAVTVYIEKTKDVNFYDDMVAGITNPLHRDPMKDLLTSICSCAVQTWVRTVHEVWFLRSSGGSDARQLKEEFHSIQKSPSTSILPTNVHTWVTSGVSNRVCEEIAVEHGVLEDTTNDVGDRGTQFRPENETPRGIYNGSQSDKGSSNGMQSFIDGLSRTLAVPSNRKLVVDVAGTMTAEAVKSFVDVVITTAGNCISTNIGGGWNKAKYLFTKQVNSEGHQLQLKSKYLTYKALLLSSICLAICLHVLARVCAMEHI